jgi:hypothetical protein
MRLEVISIADFYNNVDEVRKFAMEQEYNGEPDHFPGKRTQPFLNDSTKQIIQDVLRPLCGEVTWWGGKDSGCFQCTTAVDRSWIHSDGTTNWAGIIYLTPDAPLSAGTGIFRHKSTGLRGWVHTERTDEENSMWMNVNDHYDHTKWDMVDRIGNVYNRLIMYRGDLFHCSLDYFGKTIEDGRLFQPFFLNTER